MSFKFRCCAFYRNLGGRDAIADHINRVTLCDREGEGSCRCVYTHGQKIISTVLLAVVIYLLGLVFWFWFFIGRLSRFCWLLSVFCQSFIHSFIHYMFVDFIVYYFILDVTISHIITTVKSLIVVIRKQSFFGGGWTGVT